jgi:N-acetylmuramoyl-L-alanine amidase
LLTLMHRFLTSGFVLTLLSASFWAGSCAAQARSAVVQSAVVPSTVAQSAVVQSAVGIRDVKLWPGPDATRVVFELSSPATYTVLTLRDPDRIVVDFIGTHLEMLALPAGQGIIKQMRAGARGQDLRLVLDLMSPAAPYNFVAPQAEFGQRIVLDLVPGKAMAMSAAPPVVKSTPLANGRDIVVAIDAGHGGTDPGAIGLNQTREKDVTLAIARRLKQVIDAEPGMRAVLTRDSDQFMALRARIQGAREQQADMFVSVHADAYRDRSRIGSSVYVLSARGASDEAARWLAERENAADLLGGVSLEDKDAVLASVLLDLSQSASMSASLEAAEKVLHELYAVGNIKRQSVQQAGFLVLKSPDIPSMLVETAFITNPDEEARLNDPAHQQRLADAIHAGVRTYFYGNPPPGTRIAQLRQQKPDQLAVTPASGSVAAAGTVAPR